MKSSHWNTVFITLLLSLIAILGGTLFRSWATNQQLLARPELPPVIYQQANLQNSFLDSSVLTPGVSKGLFLEARQELVDNEQDFVEVNLEEMIITLHKEGQVLDTLPVLTKGREGSWWETPTGLYTALLKENNHFSSIGQVWMPWSIQFYGNFFIHGWPHYPDGTPVPEGYSGGCIRLSSEEAEKVFDFVDRDTPILVFDKESKPLIRPKIQSINGELSSPAITAEAALISDLDTGEMILNKKVDEVLPIASLTKLMTAVVASELIYLERSVGVTPDMLTDTIQSYPLEVGKRYRAFDLLYPLLAQSSNGTGWALTGFLGRDKFIREMNNKAVTLGMSETTFADSTGVSGENVATLKDMAKLAKYILEKRSFLFEISRGRDYTVFGSNVFSGIENYNEFYDEPGLVGVKNGQTLAAGQTLLTVWRLKDQFDFERNLFIGLLGSKDRKADGEALLNWLRNNFGVQ